MTSFELSIRVEFDAAHFLPNYNGKCENLHGHRWIVDIDIATTELNGGDMVVDFGTIKKHIADNYDHRILNKCPFDDERLNSKPFKWGHFDNPTAENIGYTIADEMKLLVKNAEIVVTVHESPNNIITVYR